MPSTSPLQAKAEVDKILRFAKKTLPAKDSKLILKFIKLYYSQTWVDDLKDRATKDLFASAKEQWKLMQHYSGKGTKIQIINPEGDDKSWYSTHTIIQVHLKDSPFLIDSMRMELNRMGFTIHLMVHMGGMNVLRDAKGNLVDILDYAKEDPKACHESPICMEIDRQTDPHVLEAIKNNLLRVLEDVRLAVDDWKPMQRRMEECIKELMSHKMPQDKAEVNESIAFLEWLLQNHFTFLGFRDYKVTPSDGNKILTLIKGSGLGVLRDESKSKSHRNIYDMPEKARELMLSKENILIISKTNTHSTVHRPTYTDYIGVKRFNDKGELIGERRFIGLYTSMAYHSVPKAIPFLRKKVASIFQLSGLPQNSHAGKDLLSILANLPRDDLFQGTVDELFEISMGVLHLQDRRLVRIFLRHDAYGRYVSCLIYVPRENFNTDLIARMQSILMETFNGLEASFTTEFYESILARMHFIIRTDSNQELHYDLHELQQRVREAGKSWYDGFRESVIAAFSEELGNVLITRYLQAFPAGYREVFEPQKAIIDVQLIETLSETNDLAMHFYRPVGEEKNIIKFKTYLIGHAMPLSDALPMLENMGLRVVGEIPYQITSQKNRVWVNDFLMTYVSDLSFEVEEVRDIFQEAFYNVWVGIVENDVLNRLVLGAKLNWRQISLLRAYAKYLVQTNFRFSYAYITEALVNNPKIAHKIVDLFELYFDPKAYQENEPKVQEAKAAFFGLLENVSSLDEDRILRRYVDLIFATLRTNYYQVSENNKPKSYISFKFNPSKVPDLPLPLPRFEIFVYAPHFEGIHLRSAKVARGGLRWSDRREDFRTEVLGLMKAQQVKNAVIVPAGAKGGFVTKQLPADGSREEILNEGIRCYQDFIHGMLDITDNIVKNKTVHPKNTVCYDDEDPYLVVAADKGTATFSDIANAISISENFWLKDAFASGGSTGYDHKKMGITARGAWVSAERHFQELGINVDETEISVVGIGDMAGDVFGNGLLMSRHMKVIAAFNHAHIFMDPNPDPEASYQERQRLFDLPRSTWDDYKKDLISKGGGVFSRKLKSIEISPQMQQVLGINKEAMVPNDLIKAILRAPVDLIWNGGIGTFVKAHSESHGSVGDRTNNGIRVHGDELRAKVIVEGGNLGFTQLGRIEYELSGGRINTDFIDNSGGVDCSDHEVNIKILLNDLVARKKLSQKDRDELLAKMTNEVAELVLQNNYHQNEALSFASYQAAQYVNLYIRFMEEQENSGRLNREIEFLPTNKELLERQGKKLGLTRPELAILFSYSKIILEDKIRQTDLYEDPYLKQFIKNAFPTPLRKRYEKEMYKHRLSREIISTQLSNFMVSHMGITFHYQMYDETGAPPTATVRAFVASYQIFHMSDFMADIEALDYEVDAKAQYQMTEAVMRLVRRSSRWFLRNRRENIDIQATIDHFSKHVDSLSKRLPKLLLGGDKERWNKHRDSLIAQNVPEELAVRIASTRPMYHSLNIIEVATQYKVDVFLVAKIYFILVDELDIVWFREQIDRYPVEDRWTVLAKAAFRGDLDWAQRELVTGVIKLDGDSKNVNARMTAWFTKYQDLIQRWKNILMDLRGAPTTDFAILSVAVRELLDLAVTSSQLR